MSRRFFDDDEDSETAAERSGRVTFDDRGNAVWAAGRRKRTSQPVLSLAEEVVPAAGPVKHNRTGLKSGYDPYESGWMARVRLSDPSEVDTLMDADAYQESLT